MSEPLTDYSNFSMEAIQASLDEMWKEVQARTGASDLEMSVAMRQCAVRFINTNFFEEPKNIS